jgi:DNA-binding CsgD family transcriptional regulator
MKKYKKLLALFTSTASQFEITSKVLESYDVFFKDVVSSIDLIEPPDTYDYLKRLHALPDRVYGIWDSSNFSFPILGDNFETVFGLKSKELINQRLVLFNQLSLDHIKWPIYVSAFLDEHIEMHKNIDHTLIEANSVGIKLKHKSGRVLRVQFYAKCIELDRKSNTGLWIGYAIDVTHLFKGDQFWSRISFGKDHNLCYHATSEQNYSPVKGDVITPREKEILILAAEGKSSKEIASQLFISLSTVDTHRKNMILKTGVRDITALIQIAKNGSII